MPERTILLVDDEDSVRNALRRALRRERYEVLDASSGAEGVAILKTTPVDVVFSDYSMPEMTGLEFLRAARMVRPDSIRILLTGNADLEMAVAAINEGSVYRFLRKPWHQLDLSVMLRLAFNHLESERRNARLLEIVRRQAQFIERLERDHPAMFTVERDADGAIVIEDDEAATLEA